MFRLRALPPLLAPIALAAGGCDPAASAAGGSAGATGSHPASAAATTATAATGAPAPGTATAAPDSTAGKHWPLPLRRAAVEEGRATLAKHQCARCHDVDGLPSTGRPYDCVKCHVFLKGLGPHDPRYTKIAAEHGKPIIDRYIRNIVHLMRVPSLTGIARRVRPEWIATFLAEPFDVRPVLEESMIRHKLGPEEIWGVVRYFAAVADVPDPYAKGYAPEAVPPKPDAARLARGRELFTKKGCPSCHVLGNVDFETGVDAEFLYSMKAESLLAPNLRFVRERVRPSVLAAWIADPASVMPGTPMPAMGVSRAEADAVRDYLLWADAGPLPAAKPRDEAFALPPPVARKVTYEEMKERTLGRVCVHCHMNDHEKDTGPGNLGGLGFTGTRLSFRTYERTVFGSVAPDGTRFSVLVPLPGETLPRLLQVLALRRVENLRDHVPPFEDRARPRYEPGLLGMPLGLPALTDEEIGIVRRWIDLGCPGPTKVSGKRGFTDGFLVPDGPAPKNKGCELRAPADKKLKWRSAPPVGVLHADLPPPPPATAKPKAP